MMISGVVDSGPGNNTHCLFKQVSNPPTITDDHSLPPKTVASRGRRCLSKLAYSCKVAYLSTTVSSKARYWVMKTC
jgi:hypothetical protein